MRYLTLCLVAGLILAVTATAGATSISFTPGQIKAVMASQGAPLSDATYQWGLWAVRAMPIVGGTGLYTIASGSTTQAGWGVSAPGTGSWPASPYTPSSKFAWFWDASGAEQAGTPANPLYMIMDKAADTFYSYTFSSSGVAIGQWAPKDMLPAPAGTNVVTAVDDSATMSFDFTLDAGASWDGQWQFVVDGSKYTSGTYAVPGNWTNNFFGGYSGNYGGGATVGGDLPGNMGAGYVVPEPLTMLAVFTGIAGLAGYIRRRKMA